MHYMDLPIKLHNGYAGEVLLSLTFKGENRSL